MDTESKVREHYSRDDLEGVLLGALRSKGIDTEVLTVDDLGGLDQLHSGGVASTDHLPGVLELGPADHLLDVGCGVGGPARRAAAHSGCRVTGLDLSPNFIAVARSLTERVGLAEKVGFDEGSATSMPYDDATFTHAMLNHAGMNIEDKASMFAEVDRVLTPGGRFGVYDIMRVGEGDLEYPLPWADDESSSFVASSDDYVAMLDQAGFDVEHVENRAPALAAGGPPAPGELSPADLFGPEFNERAANVFGAILSGLVSPMLMVARRR